MKCQNRVETIQWIVFWTRQISIIDDIDKFVKKILKNVFIKFQPSQVLIEYFKIIFNSVFRHIKSIKFKFYFQMMLLWL